MFSDLNKHDLSKFEPKTFSKSIQYFQPALRRSGIIGPRRDKPCHRCFRESETETSLPSYRDWLEHWDFAGSMLRYGTFQKANNKGADQFAQMRRLVCAFVGRKAQKTSFLASSFPAMSAHNYYFTCALTQP